MKEIAANPLLLKSLNHISPPVPFGRRRIGFFSYGIGIHLIQYEDAHNVPKKNEINTKDNHISFPVIIYLSTEYISYGLLLYSRVDPSFGLGGRAHS
ncbi:hypothetical protein Hdeb2414_s0348g00873671 [Helianthus debilis subsp. tardiflorus]